MADDGRPKTEPHDRLESALWPSIVKDRRPAELTSSGLRTESLVENSHPNKLIVDVPIFACRVAAGLR